MPLRSEEARQILTNLTIERDNVKARQDGLLRKVSRVTDRLGNLDFEVARARDEYCKISVEEDRA